MLLYALGYTSPSLQDSPCWGTEHHYHRPHHFGAQIATNTSLTTLGHRAQPPQASPHWGTQHQNYRPHHTRAHSTTTTGLTTLGNSTLALDYAKPFDYAKTFGYGKSFDYANTFGIARPFDYAKTFGYAKPVDFATIFGNANPLWLCQDLQLHMTTPTTWSVIYSQLILAFHAWNISTSSNLSVIKYCTVSDNIFYVTPYLACVSFIAPLGATSCSAPPDGVIDTH